MSTAEIDALLERYLQLLHHYTALRAELSTLQSSVHLDIARANFSSDRGIRYGQDYYDSRMRASRLVQVVPSEAEPSVSSFKLKTAPSEPANTGESLDAESSSPKNPLNMFGILVPQSLRSAQGTSITMVERVIPQIVSLDAEMKEVEIQIRRARKYHKRDLAQNPGTNDSARQVMATRDDPPPPGVLRAGPAPPYVDVRFAEEWE